MDVGTLVGLLTNKGGKYCGLDLQIAYNAMGAYWDWRCGSEFLRLTEATYQANMQAAANSVEFWVQSILSKGASHNVSRQTGQAGAGNPLGTQSGTAVCRYCGGPSAAHGICKACIASLQGRQHFSQFPQQRNQNALLNQYQQAGGFGMQAQMAQQQAASNAIAEPAEPLKITGIILGELVGYRGWRVTPEGFLKSMSATCIWAPGEVMEGKTKTREEHNGVYAYKRASDFLTKTTDAGLDVYGKVHLWGDVIEHELGYRAEFAKIVSIDGVCNASQRLVGGLRELRERYQVAA